MSLLMLLLAGGNAEAKKYKPAPRTAKNIVIAHRGYWNTPGAFENSIKAIDNAMNFGIYGSEFDINFTADDSIVVVHGSKHPVVKDLVIQESTFDKVRNTLLGNGEKVPTLREYLLAGKSDPSTQLILEIKKHPTPERENEIVAKTMAMVEELGLEKRDPQVYRIATERLRVSPGDCTLYEDAPSNCAAARLAGMTVVGVYDAFYDSYQEEMRKNSDRYIRSFTELL